MFVEWLEEELAARGWKPADLARASGLSTGTLSMIWTGSRRPGVDVATAIAAGLDLPAETVFRRAGLLPPLTTPERDPVIQELLDVARNMSPEDRKELADYAVYRYRRRKNGTG